MQRQPPNALPPTPHVWAISSGVEMFGLGGGGGERGGNGGRTRKGGKGGGEWGEEGEGGREGGGNSSSDRIFGSAVFDTDSLLVPTLLLPLIGNHIAIYGALF